jgi:predicted amidohydrolase
VRDLRVTLVQSATHWHDAAANRAHFDARLGALEPGGTDLVVLPEMFSTGFTMASAEQAETMDGPTVAWLRAQAARLDAAVCGSVVIDADGAYVNRFLAALPGGDLVVYDKRHLFRMAGEDAHYAPGGERVVFTFRDWRICPQVCYDLRFPTFCRNRLGDGGAAYDVLLFVANWPAARALHWRTLLAARAIENQAYVVAVNVIGTDGAGVVYRGDSGVWSWSGEPLAALADADADAALALDGVALRDWRGAFPAWKDADAFTLDVTTGATVGQP